MLAYPPRNPFNPSFRKSFHPWLRARRNDRSAGNHVTLPLPEHARFPCRRISAVVRLFIRRGPDPAHRHGLCLESNQLASLFFWQRTRYSLLHHVSPDFEAYSHRPCRISFF